MEQQPDDTLTAFVLCRNAACQFSEGYADLRLAPRSCPACGQTLVHACPHCGMLLRNRWGICTNCGGQLVVHDVPDPGAGGARRPTLTAPNRLKG